MLCKASGGIQNSQNRPVIFELKSDTLRSRATSPRRVCDLGGPRAARGLSDTCHTSKPGRCGEVRDVGRGCRLHSHIFGRISSEGLKLVLFAFQSLRRASEIPNPTYDFRAKMRHFAIDDDAARLSLRPRRASRSSWFVGHMTHIESDTLWAYERGLPRPQTRR